MSNLSVTPFYVIGISIRTSNAEGKAIQEIPQLWDRFMTEGILAKIPNRLSEDIYCIYTDYDGDHSLPYTTLIGCRVANLDAIPESMVGKAMPGGNYRLRSVQGNLQEGAVFDAWNTIWQEDFPRGYTADYEVYAEKAQHPADVNLAEVDIFISI